MRTYKEAHKILSMMKASQIGALVEGLNYESLSCEERNRLSANWAKRIAKFSRGTIEQLAMHLPQIIISDQLLEKLKGLGSVHVGNNKLVDDVLSLMEDNVDTKGSVNYNFD